MTKPVDELVDILTPPMFTRTGTVKPRTQAWADGDWISTFNLWVVQAHPVPAIVYQIRSPKAGWAPGKMDLAAAGHYQTGETGLDGLREAQEELAKTYDPAAITHVGRRLYVGLDQVGRHRNNVVEMYITTDNSPLTSYELQASEVYALCVCPIAELLKVHTDPAYSFKVPLLTGTGETVEHTVNAGSFPENYDNYHYKMAVLAGRYLEGEPHLVY